MKLFEENEPKNTQFLPVIRVLFSKIRVRARYVKAGSHRPLYYGGLSCFAATKAASPKDGTYLI